MKKLFALAALATALLLAQFDTAQVLGSVQDASGGGIAGAEVTLTNTQTGVQQKAVTDTAGSYQFFNVKAGSYKLEGTAKGFKSAVANTFSVTVNARQRVDLKLEVGSTSESITVTDAVAVLETDTSSRGTVVGTQQVVNLPLNGRAYADLALLAPGVRRSSIADTRDASFNVNGMRSSQNNFVIDGVDNNAYGTSNQGFSNQVVQLSPDSVQEFRLETNNFSAEFGRAGGAVINASIRSGTNSFHGSAWEYLRNTKLNATGFFKPVNNQKPTLIQNQYGAAFGGAIKKDKSFFFGDFEGYRRNTKRITFSTLPTRAEMNGNLGISVRNPLDGTVIPNGVVPQTQITRWAREVLAGLPDPNRPGLSNNFESQPLRTDKTDKGDFRYDHYFSSKLNAFGRYSHRLMENFEPPALPGPSGGDSNGNVRVENRQLAFGTSWTVNPTSILEFRLGYSRSDGGKFPVFVGTGTLAEKIGIPNAPTDKRFAGGVYRQAVNGYSAFGVQESNPQFQNPDVFNPKVNYVKVLGRHSLKAGWEYQRVSTEIDDFNPKSGRDVYNGRFSQVPGTANNNLQFLNDFFYGARNQFALNSPNIVNYRQWMHFFYLQDDFKVSRKLTLNVGIRYEFATPQFEATNAIANFDPSTNTTILAKDGSLYDRALVNPDGNNWAPRIGMAYTVLPKTVIRAAYGVSYVHFNRMGGENLLAYNLPFILNPTVDAQLPPAFANGLPLCTSQAQGPGTCFRRTEQGYPTNFLSLANIRQVNTRTNHIPKDLRSAYNQNWHVTIQQELMKGWVLDVGYVGTAANKLMILGDFNQARPNVVGQNLALQARRPLQAYGFIQTAFPGGFLDYHAFQSKIEKRFSGGMYFLNSFTFSKAIDNASGHLESGNGDNSRVNFRALENEKGLSGYDQPFNNTTTFLYDLPFGKSRKFGDSWSRGVDAIAGGWRVSIINFSTSGVPVNLSYGPSAAFQVSGAPTYRPNITGNPVLPEGQRSPAGWLNRATVLEPTDVSQPFGNAGRNIVRAPSFNQMNFGLHKDFRVIEGHKVEFRMEAFNFFNKTNFDPPNGNRTANNFGAISNTRPAREIQFALRYAF
ncbi:MAG: TonB-dependent receptor [Acidobacteria bacterium]|nr:TonB-dependent receptor [Acidobacteriota bacterium]